MQVDSIKFIKPAHSWLDGGNNIVSAVWTTITNANDTLTIILSGPATYLDTTPAKPTVVVGDTISINWTITDSSGKAIISTVQISGSFGIASTVIPNTAVADDNSVKGPNIQANDRVVITFSGATNAPVIDATNINTILPLPSSTVIIDDFSTDTSGSWSTGILVTDSVSGGVYNVQSTWSTVQISFYKGTSFSGANNTLEFIYKGYGASGPSLLTVYYTDSGNNCASYSATCSQSFAIIQDSSWHTLTVTMTDSEWNSTDTINNIRFDFGGATGIGTMQVDSIKFIKPAHSWLDGGNNIVSAVWTTITNANDTLTITLSGLATYADTTPIPPTVIVGDTISINGTITDSTGKAIISTVQISGNFGVASTSIPNTAVADDNSGKGPNIQANDRVVITFAGATNAPVIDATNINTILPVSGKTWLDGSATPTIVSAVLTTITNANDTLTIILSGPATYIDTTPAKPTVVVGDTISINGTITDSSGKAIISTVQISGNFGVASTSIPNTAVADDNSGKGPNIQANEGVIITFSGATNAPVIDATNINTILPLPSSTVIIDDFSTDTSGSWSTGILVTDSVSGGVYNVQSTWSTVQISFYKGTSFSGANNTLEFIYKGYGASGPSLLTVYYTDSGNNCASYSATCSQSFAIIQDSSWHTLTVTMTDSEWNSTDTINNIRFDFGGATGIGTMQVDSIKFIKPAHSWLDGGNNIVSAVWTTITNANDTLTITLSGPATYIDTTPAKPTVVVGDTISINGTITDSSGKAIISSRAITGSFGVSSISIPSSAVADDNSGKGPNIQANDRVVITFAGATNAPVIDATNINTILPLPSSA